VAVAVRDLEILTVHALLCTACAVAPAHLAAGLVTSQECGWVGCRHFIQNRRWRAVLAWQHEDFEARAVHAAAAPLPGGVEAELGMIVALAMETQMRLGEQLSQVRRAASLWAS
jgi:hypothetical protein